MKSISFVIPCYRSAVTLPIVIDELTNVMQKMKDYQYEIICVNDASPDNTFEVIKELCKKNDNMVGIDLAKNFGQHSAIMAGLNCAWGDIIISLDDDGQMPLESIPELILKIEQGADVVFGRYVNKRHSKFRNLGSLVNDKMCCILLEKPKELYVSSFWAMKKFVAEEMIKYEGAYPYLLGLILRVTRNIDNVDVIHRERAAGQTGYSLIKLFSLWMNGFTAFSVKPLRLATICGCLSSVIGFIYGVIMIIRKILNPNILLGYSSLLVVNLFLGGMIMFMLGIVGEYIGRMYICINNSPQYVIRRVVGVKTEITKKK